MKIVRSEKEIERMDLTDEEWRMELANFEASLKGPLEENIPIYHY